MPPIDKIKSIRRQVNCTLQQAIRLLNQTYLNCGKYDIEQAITVWHQDNIELIYQVTQDRTLAKIYYERYKNVKKAITNIQDIQATAVDVLTIQPDVHIDKIRFHLYKEHSTSGERDKTDQIIYVPFSDFNYVIPAFKAVFPTYNDRFDMTEDNFDACFDNRFTVRECQIIVINLQKLNETLYRPEYSDKINDEGYTDKELITFRLEIIDWITQRFLLHSSSEDYHLVVEGNL